MGFLSKAKGFFGGQSMLKVEFTRLERQDPAAARFPVTDSVLKGNIRVTAEQDCVVLKHVYRILLKITPPDSDIDSEAFVCEDAHDKTTDIMGANISWPYELKAGESKEDGFLLHDVDLAATLAKYGYPDPNMAVNNPAVKLVVVAIADVKGSPFDPKAELVVTMTGDEAAVAAPTGPKPTADRVLAWYEDGFYEAKLIESGPEGHHILWDDGADTWVTADQMRPSGTALATKGSVQPGQRVMAKYEEGFFEATVGSLDWGDMVNPAKAFLNWEDGSESWVAMADVRLIQ